MIHVVNYYLGPETPASLQATSSIAKLSQADQDVMQGFVLEALRKFQNEINWLWVRG